MNTQDIPARILKHRISPRRRRHSLVDHIVGNVELGKMNYWCDFYRDVLGFSGTYVSTTRYLDRVLRLMSIVMSDGGHNIRFPINEPAEAEGKIADPGVYRLLRSAGAQHIALLCKDIRQTVTKLQRTRLIPDRPRHILRRAAITLR